VLELEASDVIHSWWIPKFGPKADAVPGYVNETWFKVENEGEYRGQCAELCGSGHADMRATVRAVPPDEFQTWADNKRREIQQAGEELAAQRKQGEGDEGK
jgi:cytochrome c oxidase subunit 2